MNLLVLIARKHLPRSSKLPGSYTPIIRSHRRLQHCLVLLAVVCLFGLSAGVVSAMPPLQADSPLATPVEPSAVDESGASAQDSARRSNSGSEGMRSTGLAIDLGLVLVVAVLAVVVLVAGYQTWRPS